MYVVCIIWLLNTGLSSAFNKSVLSQTKVNERIRCGDKLIFYTDNGKFGTDKYTVTSSGLLAPERDQQLKCRYSVRSNQPTFLYWLHLSTQFDGIPNNCSLHSNIIAIDVGCLQPRKHCITNKDQKAERLYSTDGCFDVEVTTSMNGDGFLAFFEKPTFSDVDYGHEMEGESSFSDNLAYIIICPIVFVAIIITLLCVLMRRKQHKRLREKFQAEEKLICRPNSISISLAESPLSPGEKPTSSRLSQCEKNFEPGKRASHRYSQRPPSEYRYSKVRYSRAMSEESQRPPSEMRKSPAVLCSNVLEELENKTYLQQQTSQGNDSNVSKETNDTENGIEVQEKTTHFIIENPMEHEANVDDIAPVLVPLRSHENHKRLSRADRLSSLDSFFDENILCIEEEDIIMDNSRLIRYDSSDSYFDMM